MSLDIEDSTVNREKTCPLLLRMFYNQMKHYNVSEYCRGRAPSNELQVYTWLDATLRELASLVKQVNPDARKRGTLFDFALVTPDARTPVYRMRELGVVCAGTPSDTDRIMLKDCQFTIGDMVDVAITPPPVQLETPYYSATSGNTADLNIRGARRNSPGFFRSRRDFYGRGRGEASSGSGTAATGSYDRVGDEVTLRKVIDNTSSKDSRVVDKHHGSDRGRYDADRRRRDNNFRTGGRRMAPY